MAASQNLSKLFFCYVVLLTVLICIEPIKSQEQVGTLADDEALREIAVQLNKKDWNFSDPCSNIPTISIPRTDEYNNTLVCNCSFSGNVCHIQSIFLTGQDLDGVLPPALSKLPYLKQVNLARNYLSGSIPREWNSTKVELLVLSVNNLSGPIPGYLGSITTLQSLALESNLFSGTLPLELGNLVNLELLYLRANNLTGELPSALTKMTKLRVLQIGSNNFTGRIPDYFRSWKNLQALEMQASGLEGPLPSSLSALHNMTDLRISDLSGESSAFPNLSSMTGINKLMLRSCNITGEMPEYISAMRSLTDLDLSFNRLEGSIPNFADIMELATMILSNCLFPCSKDRYSLHLNCGGNQTTVGNIKYEADDASGGAAKFFQNSANWGFSSTGDFADVWSSNKDYIANNISILRMNNSELYKTARLSPLSLTYYARCLANGNYTVKLHFAEIVIRDNRSYYGVGRRIFNVYIQDKLVLEDFDIEKEAQGVDKEVIKVFKAVVNVKTLEIRFQWAGKGTTNVPKSGTYGSLISAISVQSDFKPPDDSKRKKFIVIGVVSALFLVFVILGILWLKGCFGGRTTREQDLMGFDLHTGFFKFKQLKAATNNFDAANKLGEGGFGAVYKGELLDGTFIAVKQLSSKSKQGNREFVNEIGMISALQHPNLVKLYGCCIEGNQLFLVYEYMENNSLSHVLFGPEEGLKKLNWNTRYKICLGIARGLAFLHEESTLKIVHRDIKTTNILLDRDLNPKISDFGLAKLDEEEKTHISTRVAGTISEELEHGFSFSSSNVINFSSFLLHFFSTPQALVLQQNGNLMELVDRKLGSAFNKEEALRMIKVALLCANSSPALRPTMSAVVSMLEGQTLVHEVKINPSIYGDELRFRAFTEDSDTTSVQSTQSLLYSPNAKRTAYTSLSV
ncbi:hypothetical protein C1H46_035715 [Malus baccata]|uniref:non-specific serine/threonine protein kinase n=1 Tax=Malus baccata TaxID=106549 RepID=A0A540KWV3_MALBA|nr:hypothetical protein C1H46_035715 [Malus baccata]